MPNEPANPNSTAANVFVLIICLAVFVSFVATPRMGPDRTPITQVLLSFVFLIVGYWLYRLRQVLTERLLGMKEIAAGIASNWFQIPKFANEGVDRPERAIFVFAAIALIAHGFKKVKDPPQVKSAEEDD